MARLRWGILAASNIARKFVRDVQLRQMTVQAVASRDPEKAARFAAEFGLPGAHGSYQALLDDPAVDVVYISLPNHLHVSWCLAAAQAGKHILCEKPLCATEAECERVLQAVERAGVFFMEAFMYRCHPLWTAVRERLGRGDLGEIRLIHSYHSYDMGLNLANVRHQPGTEGGALMDVGCYCVSLSRYLLGEEPEATQALSHVGEQTRVDEWTAGQMRFPSGAVASFQCATRVPQPTLAVVFGSRGRVEVPSPWHLDKDAAEARWFHGGEPEVTRHGDGLPLYAREALAVEAHLGARQCPAMPWADSLGQARALEMLRSSAGLVG